METVKLQKLLKKDGEYIAYQQQNSKLKHTKPGVIFLHGFHSDMQGTKAVHLAQLAEAHDFTFTRFDCYGHGTSSGTMPQGSISRWLDDCLTVLDTLTTGPQILVGSSMGGWLMLLAALRRPERVCGLIGIAAAPDFMEELIWDYFSPAEKEQLMQEGSVPMHHQECSWTITRTMIEDGRQHRLLQRSQLPIHCPVTLLHSRADEDVPHHTALRLANVLTETPVTLHLIPDDNHRMSSPESLALLEEALLTMLKKF